jgi:cytochrome d ubiquinol oxidase subunit II
MVEVIIAGLMAGALILYALLGGADYGGGVWDLLATGPRAREQRQLIADAIAPVWEANHVWLILVLVILFTAFPPAFAAIGTALHIPLTLMLVGVVLRGTAFTFRHYDDQHDQVQRRWSLIFSIASIITPILLGVSVGAVASGNIRAPEAGGSFIWPWLAPFPFAVGFLALALFAFLAAVFLTVEARDRTLADDFRRRAIGAGIAVFVSAAIALLLARQGRAPRATAGAPSRERRQIGLCAREPPATGIAPWPSRRGRATPAPPRAGARAGSAGSRARQRLRSPRAPWRSAAARPTDPATDAPR